MARPCLSRQPPRADPCFTCDRLRELGRRCGRGGRAAFHLRPAWRREEEGRRERGRQRGAREDP